MEGVPKQPERSEVETVAPEGGIEKQEAIERAQALHEWIMEFDGQTVDRETYEQLRAASAELTEKLHTLSWRDCVDNDLPWDPNRELREQVANENLAPAKAVA